MSRILLPLMCFMLIGCVERTISISSQPNGALVYLNDEEVGRTPVDVPFTFYGVYDVRMERDGFKPLWTTHEAVAPWWENPGPDLIAEMLPGRRKVNLKWHFEMVANLMKKNSSSVQRSCALK
jgi:hypothetical protein